MSSIAAVSGQHRPYASSRSAQQARFTIGLAEKNVTRSLRIRQRKANEMKLDLSRVIIFIPAGTAICLDLGLCNVMITPLWR